MKTASGHLTYCTNIHAGESWADHFGALKKNIPGIKKQLSPNNPFGIGLRLSHIASVELSKEENLEAFKKWLDEAGCYVFTMNGFPYGGFHHTRVKDDVHKPDWTTEERVQYTLRMFTLLSALLPAGMEGGISTSPLSYKYWHSPADKPEVFNTATTNLLKVVLQLISIKNTTGKLMHLDLEPEPDGLIENGPEFFSWYKEYLLPQGITFLRQQLQYEEAEAIAAIKTHVQLCYDICHFAVGYENHDEVVRQLKEQNIKVGKIQISAALKAPMKPLAEGREEVIGAFRHFNESTYLHQVVALSRQGTLLRYPDLPQALEDASNPAIQEWRSHFHVPLFVKDYGALQSTQEDIQQVLALQKRNAFTSHLEVETYTWEVLPDKLKLPLNESIIREMQWVQQALSD
jgi:hypothetical protein